MAEHECVQDQRIGRIEEKIDKLYEGDTEQKILMTEFRISLKEITKSNEIMQEYLKESQVTFKKINENLDHLNAKSDSTDKKIESTDGKIEQIELKVDHLSKELKNSEEKNIITIDQRLWIKNILTKIILPVGSGGFIIYEVLKLFGVFD